MIVIHVDSMEDTARLKKACEKINAFLKKGIPMEQWVGLLQAGCHKEKNYVKYNYEGMNYFE